MDLTSYVMRNELDHVLLNPDTYVGSIENVEGDNWVFKDDKIVQLRQTYNPALLKLFDEGIVNASDHIIRTRTSQDPVTYIKVSIQEDTITIVNDGEGIDVALHPEHKIYIPQLIFANMRTSRNFNVDEKRIVGGKNGFGVKLIFIWSTFAQIEIVDSTRHLKYTQIFTDNLSKIQSPVITPCKKKSYTSITFKPDYKRLKLDGLSDTMKSLFLRRIYDIAAITDKSVKVSYNDELIPVRTMQQYIDMYVGPKTDVPRVHYACERWEVTVCKSADEFAHVSYVNGINTNKGGTHVNYILNQLLKKLTVYMKLKKKIDVKPAMLKENIMLFVSCFIENPSFDSQTKDYLNTPSANFGSSCELPDKLVEDIAKKWLMDLAVSLTHIKDLSTAKKSDGAKTKKIVGIPKLIDANYAGTAKSGKCTLILCEGDSARSAIISGFTPEDRNIYGVYPMRGKLLNVRDESITTVSNNKEIKEMMIILGLKYGKEYTQENMNELRYGRVLFMTDQDLDGSHIKALCINVFDCLWTSLIKQPQFIGFMNTPIIKAKKSSQELIFYNEDQYMEWKKEDKKGWTIKYYKGLGTSTSSEFKKYFTDKKIVHFTWTPECKDNLDMVFNKKRSDDRKSWLERYSPQHLNTNVLNISYSDLVNKDVIKFSKYDCDRSIPNMVDGFKISQRKIFYGAITKPILHEIKVAQFSGYVSEKSSYHHGEASLNGAIVNMAQDFVGSNNINLLKPNGQFGTRLQGGKDSASERYIFTQLNECTRYIFRPEDDAVLTYLMDDGFKVEPAHYFPIIPMILVNGCNGIGTGFSTKIPCYNPADLIEYISALLVGKYTIKKFIPYYRGFKGSIDYQSAGKYIIRGVYSVDQLQVTITELPIGTWTDTYKQFLEDSIGTLIKEYTDKSTDVNIHIQITLLAPLTNVESELKLTTSISTTNMHLFTDKDQLKKYKNVQEIIGDYYTARIEMYHIRKKHMLVIIEAKLHEISNRVAYIRAILNDTLDLRNKKQEVILKLLADLGLDPIQGSYSYLIKMPMDSVSQENIQSLEKDLAKLILEKTTLETTSVEQLWLNELKELKLHLK